MSLVELFADVDNFAKYLSPYRAKTSSQISYSRKQQLSSDYHLLVEWSVSQIGA